MDSNFGWNKASGKRDMVALGRRDMAMPYVSPSVVYYGHFICSWVYFLPTEHYREAGSSILSKENLLHGAFILEKLLLGAVPSD